MNSNYEMIDTRAGVIAVARSFEKEKAIAVDLEADSMYHFKERVCLIQMATKKVNIVVDPLAAGDLSPLKSLFLRRDIQKIFHGADYDIRSLYRDFRIKVNNLFDTELACRFIGVQSTGLDAVVKKYFNIPLNKKYQKKDWSKRPLPEEMIEYAARDVIYLLSLAEILEKELYRNGRRSWVAEECEYLSNVRPMPPNDDPLFLKSKGAGRLQPRSLAVLEALLQFRKNVAEKKDQPLFKVFGNDSMIKMATEKPLTLRRLKSTKALSKRQINIYGDALLETIQTAVQISEKDFPVYPRTKTLALSRKVPERVKALKKWRDKTAGQLKMDPSLICNKALLTDIAVRNPSDTNELETVKNIKNWQKTAFGEEIIMVLKK